VADRRYSTAAWQRLRKAVLAHYGHVCQLQGPRCTGYATTVHHIVPSSQRPDLFWAEENLTASCGPCNYAGGSRVRADNERRRIEQLEEIIVDQDQRIQQLLERLSQYEPQHPQTGLRRNPPKPAIY
jgi:5-methylcytosine-specific restriction endonuclease McrA